MKRAINPNQMSLFDDPQIPKPVSFSPGSLDYDLELRGLMSEALKKSPKSRYQVAAKMSELIGQEVSKSQLDAWTAESRESWRFPFVYGLAFEVALDSFCLTEFLARRRGVKIVAGDEIRQAEIGRLESIKEEISKKLKALKQSKMG